MNDTTRHILFWAWIAVTYTSPLWTWKLLNKIFPQK